MAQVGFTSRNTEIGGLKFHYTDWGGDGPPLVMLHGLTGHARTWDHTAAALTDRYRVLALDQRGHGDSEWAPQYGLAPMAQDVLGFLDALELIRSDADGPVHGRAGLVRVRRRSP